MLLCSYNTWIYAPVLYDSLQNLITVHFYIQKILNVWFFKISATFGNPNAGGGINNGAAAIKLESHSSAGSGNGSNYYTCATYGSPSPGAQEHHQQQQGLLATSAYSKFTVFQRVDSSRDCCVVYLATCIRANLAYWMSLGIIT